MFYKLILVFNKGKYIYNILILILTHVIIILVIKCGDSKKLVENYLWHEEVYLVRIDNIMKRSFDFISPEKPKHVEINWRMCLFCQENEKPQSDLIYPFKRIGMFIKYTFLFIKILFCFNVGAEI